MTIRPRRATAVEIPRRRPAPVTGATGRSAGPLVTDLILTLITAEINERKQQANCPGRGDEKETAYFPDVAAADGFMCPLGCPAYRDKCVVTSIRHVSDEMAIQYGGEAKQRRRNDNQTRMLHGVIPPSSRAID
jgi:hypothetical protein